MQIDLTGKTALVTGSTEGIGYAIVSQLAREDANVVINGRSEEKTANARTIRRAGARTPSPAARSTRCRSAPSE
ncbi:NAD(P)-dependent dehydrogenase (short-subunit alcohol dehydrogenase family) [Rhizobium sp. BK077]|nr:NAD(P)-dependent dehydrogenase (short-subunit alcohol dehydrogenase family) [Rhizobium sp. BK112]MBB3371858.1 NAD(P)-dependent dehydrogenase (short-subunit alcohol dehydrogenase family) [Rhizobium sp. BK077]MBB4182825.1 NAD(P)-dependent dehydrogenase (short-subunit alcohol dehydrogenase family) [Rhizobium sp. BK109]